MSRQKTNYTAFASADAKLCEAFLTSCKQAGRLHDDIPDEVDDRIADVRHIVPRRVVQASPVAVAVHGVHMEVPRELRHDAEEAGAVHGLRVQQHQRLQIVSYFVILKAGVPAFIKVFFVSHLPKCTIDAGEARLPAQVFRLKLILSAVLDEMRSALAELEIDTLPDALFTDVGLLNKKIRRKAEVYKPRLHFMPPFFSLSTGL